MSTRTSTELHTDHLAWWQELCAWQEEVKSFERRLGEILQRGADDTARAQAEQYQNRLIREQEVIDELQHMVKTHEDSLAKKAHETPHVAAEAPYVDHVELRDRMRTAAVLHQELRNAFRAWASGRLGPMRPS